jgi:hypothetical protein
LGDAHPNAQLAGISKAFALLIEFRSLQAISFSCSVEVANIGEEVEDISFVCFC